MKPEAFKEEKVSQHLVFTSILVSDIHVLRDSSNSPTSEYY